MAAIKYPRLCLSHTVKGTCSVKVTGVGPLATLAEGVYWTDRIYDGLTTCPPDLFTAFALALDTAAGTDTAFIWDNSELNYSIATTCDTPATTLEFGHASTTAEARRLAKRLGFNPIATTADLDNAGNERRHGAVEGYWESPRGEFSKLQEDLGDGNAASSAAWSGYTYGFRLGESLRRYLLRLQSVPELYTHSRGAEHQVQSGFDAVSYPYDLSFEARVYQYLKRGEMVRLYADAAASHTSLASAMTALSNTAVVNNGSIITAGTNIWVDGECMYVESKAVNTLTVWRPNPESHLAYSPVSTDFVATYVLDTDGGNVNLRDFPPVRRAHNQNRYDLDIALIRSKWVV